MDGPQKVASGLVVARGNGSVLLQACEEVLDQMTRLQVRQARWRIAQQKA